MSKIKQASFAFSAGLLAPADMYACSEVIVNESDVVAINPFTKMIPNVSCTEDLKVLVEIHNRLPLFQEVYPNCHFGRLIHLTAHAKQIDTVQKMTIFQFMKVSLSNSMMEDIQHLQACRIAKIRSQSNSDKER